GGNSGVEKHHQHDGGSAQRLRLGSDTRGARSGYGGQAGWPGTGQGRGGYLERFDGQCELDGVKPDQPGAQHRRGHNGRGAWRSRSEERRVGKECKCRWDVSDEKKEVTSIMVNS